MKLTLEPTSQIVRFNEPVESRIWQGTTDTGIPVQVLVVRVACSTEHNDECERLARELIEQPVPCIEPNAFVRGRELESLATFNTALRNHFEP